MAEQLVNDAQNLSAGEWPGQVVVVIKGLTRPKTAAIHLGVHDLCRCLLADLFREHGGYHHAP